MLVLLQVSCSGDCDGDCLRVIPRRGDHTELRYTGHPHTDERCIVVAIVYAPQAQILVREYVSVLPNKGAELRKHVSVKAKPIQEFRGEATEGGASLIPTVAEVIGMCHVLGWGISG